MEKQGEVSWLAGVALIYDTSCYSSAVSSFHICNNVSRANLCYISKMQCFLCMVLFFFPFIKSTLKTGHVSTFSVLGRSSRSSIHRSVFQQSVPSPSYFPTSHDLPCAAETRGKVAALRRLDTGQNWQRTYSQILLCQKTITHRGSQQIRAKHGFLSRV